MALRPGDHLARYAIQAIVGEGGMGRVYRAYDEHLHRHVALKVVRTDEATDEEASAEAAARLLQEARAAAALDHPNAVSVFDAGEVDGTIYIAMEFVDGTPLRAFVPPRGDAPPELRVRWLVDVARALAAAHDRGLVHRDVKPENVLVRKDGVVKVLDFGIAKRVGALASAGAATLGSGAHPAQAPFDALATAAGRLVGTPRYMAPEQVRGDRVDGRTDQFGWAVLAYELLSGDVPWRDAHDGPKLFSAVLRQEAPPLEVAGVPPLVGEILAVALRKRPEERLPSMHDVVAALEPLVHASGGAQAARGAVIRVGDPTPYPTNASTWLQPAATTAVRPRRRAFAWAGLAGLALAAVVAFGVRARGERGAPLLAAASASAATVGSAGSTGSAPGSSSLGRFAVGRQPLPAGLAADAAGAYRAAMQAFRDASFEAAQQGLARTLKLDPTFGAAHLRAALLSSLVSNEEQEARRSFRSATSYRATMDDRDRALLDAFEPYFQRDPSDLAEAEGRIARVVAQRPDDAEAWFWLGYVRFDRGLLPTALEAFQRATALDPEFALALSNQGGVLAYLGRFADAQRVLDRCLSVSPAATDCIWYRALIAEQDGRCGEVDTDLRLWIAKDPEDYYAYQMLAKTLFAERRSSDAVLEAYEQKWRRLPEAKRSRDEAMDRARVDVMQGRFDEAEPRMRAMEAAVARESGALAHAIPAQLLIELYQEEGRSADARAVAEAFLSRRDAWAHPHRIDDRAITEDVTLEVQSALVRAGALSKVDFAARRAEWLAQWRARTTGAYLPYLWLAAYAQPAETRADAEEALAALPSFGALPPFFPQTLALAHVGKVQALAGRAADALPLLRRASGVCLALEDPFTHTENALVLGETLASTGDRAGACAAYAVVLERWGGAKPKSRTADAARARAKALGCAK